MTNNGWTSERRKKQAEAIREWKPWENSTGAKSSAGKENSKMNAFKHGLYGAEIKGLHSLLREQKKQLMDII